MSGRGIRKEELGRLPDFWLEPLRRRRRGLGKEGDGFHCEHIDLLIPMEDPSGDAWEAAACQWVVGGLNGPWKAVSLVGGT